MQEPALAQLVICLAFALTIWRFTRAFPVQNVGACATVILTASILGELFAARTGFPSGPFFFTENLGYSLVRAFRLQTTPGSLALPWPVPLIWVINLLNSRGTARLILKPWRHSPSYGFWLLAIAGALATILNMLLEPFAAANHWWMWLTSKEIPSWYGAPWIHFVASAIGSIFLLAFVTPWLINKKPAKELPPDIYPFWIWLSLLLLLTLSTGIHRFWSAVVLGLVVAAFSIFMAYLNPSTSNRQKA